MILAIESNAQTELNTTESNWTQYCRMAGSIHVYSILHGWIKRTTRWLFAIKARLSGHTTNKAHFRESHDQDRTLLESCDEYHPLLSHTANTATVLHFVFIKTTLSAAFIDASGLVGDAKQMCLPCFDDYLSIRDNLLPFAWFSISGNLLLFAHSPFCCDSTHAKTVYQSKHRGEYCMWTTWKDSMRLTPHAVLQSRPHPSYHYFMYSTPLRALTNMYKVMLINKEPITRITQVLSSRGNYQSHHNFHLQLA